MTDAVGNYVDSIPVLADQYYGGAYQIRGTVDRLGSPGRFFVRLRHGQSFSLLRGAVTNEAGEYSIPYLINSASSYVLVVQDRDWRFGSGKANAAISDQVVLEPMP